MLAAVSDFVGYIETAASLINSMRERVNDNKAASHVSLCTVDELNSLQESKQLMLDVGGVCFHISHQSLTERSSILTILGEDMFADDTDQHGYHFIDRDPKLFPILLEYLRNASFQRLGILPIFTPPPVYRALIREATYYAMAGFVSSVF